MNFLDHFMKRLFTLRFGFKSQSETILGVDISSAAIKLVEIESSSDGFNVIAYGVQAFSNPVAIGANNERN